MEPTEVLADFLIPAAFLQSARAHRIYAAAGSWLPTTPSGGGPTAAVAGKPPPSVSLLTQEIQIIAN